MKIYTKTGDDGTTSLYGGRRVKKNEARIDAYGTIDELNSFVGLCASSLLDTDVLEVIIEIQKRLFTIGSSLANDPIKKLDTPDILETDIQLLETTIDNLNEDLEPLKNFIIPGGNKAVSYAHICRTIARRAERRVVSLSELESVDPIIIKYLNRLSDFFFILARAIANDQGCAEIPWLSR
jgi:cob(I)alamin adenosyltransferase